MVEGFYFALGGSNYRGCMEEISDSMRLDRAKPKEKKDPDKFTITGIDANGDLHAFITDDLSKAKNKREEWANSGYTEIIWR